MKKYLLLGAALIGLSSIASAQVVDNATYNNINGIKCENKWLWSRNHNKAGFEGLEFIANAGTRARTAAIDPAKEKVYVAWNPQFTEINGTDTTTTEFGRIATFDLKTGKYEGYVQLTENGTPITGTLTVSQIGVDDFGNIWFTGMNVGPTQEKPIKIYVVDNIETGECRQVGQWALPAEEESEAGRVDYCDVVGDITGQEANAVMMAAVGVFGADNVNGLYRWELPQGETEWIANEEDFAGYVSTRDLTETYPEGNVSWGASSAVVKIVKEDESDFSGALFYVDGFNAPPALYNTALSMLESFASAPELCPASGCNGITEFNLAGKNFVAYAEAQYDKDPGCRVNICELGEGMTFEGMKKYWSVPEIGLGQLSDGGNRVHSIATKKYVDENGNEGVYLLTYKCYNGIGLYLIAENGFIEPTSSTPSTIKATSVTLSSTALGMTIGTTSQLTATVLPENATHKAVTWTSSNTSVATVNATGVVTAIASGSATITATTTDGTKLSASCVVTVVDSDVIIDGIKYRATDENQHTASAIGTTINSGHINVLEKVDFEMEYFVTEIGASAFANSNATSVTLPKTISKIGDNAFGDISTLVSLNTTPPACTSAAFGNLNADAVVYVPEAAYANYWLDAVWGKLNIRPITSVVTSLSLNGNVTIPVNDAQVLTPTFIPANPTIKQLSWSSSNPTVATVDNNGLVTTIKKGTAIITATTIDGSNISASCEIKVIDKLVNSISVTPMSITIEQYATAYLSCTVMPTDAVNKSVVWFVENPEIVALKENGDGTVAVLGLQSGTTNVVVLTTDGSELTASCEVTVVGKSTGIDGVEDNAVIEVARYDIHGRLLCEPTKGINIVKMSDGTVRKEIVK
ncbi:MAG: hypothetical protein E7081_05420 [Bacteroidales bacterium]|nr:hypothetical protein [Bacteroidales bacterium]